MEVVTWIIFSIIGIYILTMIWMLKSYFSLKFFEEKKAIAPQNTFSIVIPFRNEAQRISSLLLSLTTLQYPKHKYEIIFVDDDSTDESDDLISSFEGLPSNISIIKNSRTSHAPKKDAITTAVNCSKFDWIVTTDADCFVDENWITVLDQFIQEKNPKMVCGAVSMVASPRFLEQFQQYEFLSLQGITMGTFGLRKPILCSGANLAYQKELFLELNGFSGNQHIASGDDVFLLEKASQKYPEDIHFLKNTSFIVLTQTAKTWNDLLHQKIRWASKTSDQKNRLNSLLALLVIMTNLTLLATPFLWVFDVVNFATFYWVIGSKIMMDSLFIAIIARYIRPGKMKYFIASSLFYPIYLCIVVAFALQKKYEWKGRAFTH